MNYRKTIGSQFFGLIILFIFSFMLLDCCPASAQEGTLKWSIDIGVEGEGISSPVVGVDGTIYVGCGDKLYAINPNGTQKWVLTVSAIHRSPAIGHDGTIYVGQYYLYAINPNGTQKWVLTGSASHTSPAIGHDGTIYTTRGPSLNAINPDGTQKWAVEFSVEGQAISVGIDGTIYFLGLEHSNPGCLFRDCYDLILYAINSDGTYKWKSTMMSGTPSPSGGPLSIGSDGTIYGFTGEAGEKRVLFAVNPDGSTKWSSEDWNDASSLTIGVDSTIYFQDYGSDSVGYLIAINPDGTRKWIWERTPGGVPRTAPAIGDDGTIYAAPAMGPGTMYAVNPDGITK